MAYYSKLEKSTAAFSDMMKKFGIVTVMNADIYEIPADYVFSNKTAYQIRDDFKNYSSNNIKKLARIETLKVANITVEGPSKTVTGGQYSNPLIKFGKTARFEMQDALGRADAIEAFGGSVNEYSEKTYENVLAMHVTEDFAPARLIIGDSFFIDQAKGQQVPVNIIFYQVSPDSIFNLTQDAEGDATVFDMNADLLTTNILIGDKNGSPISHGVFYSIIDTETPANEDVTDTPTDEGTDETLTDGEPTE